MDKKQDGGPAFAHGNPVQGGSDGMSLRDYLISQQAHAWQLLMGTHLSPKELAEHAAKAAAAMLKARGHVE